MYARRQSNIEPQAMGIIYSNCTIRKAYIYQRPSQQYVALAMQRKKMSLVDSTAILARHSKSMIENRMDLKNFSALSWFTMDVIRIAIICNFMRNHDLQVKSHATWSIIYIHLANINQFLRPTLIFIFFSLHLMTFLMNPPSLENNWKNRL